MKTIFGVLMILCLTAGTVLAECSDADKKALEVWDRDWSAASQSGNRAKLMEIYADDYVDLPDGSTKTAAVDSAVRAFERNKTNPTPDKVSHDHYMITCTPNSALITHRNTIWTANGTGGKPETFWTRSVHMLEKRNGKWVAVSNAGNSLDDIDTLAYLERDYDHALMARNKEWFEKHLADDYIYVNSRGEVVNKKKDIEDMVNDKGLEWAGSSDLNINVSGNNAVVTGIYHVKGKDDKGVAYDRRSRYIDTWVRRDGVWQVWTSQSSALPTKEVVAQQ